MAIPLKVNPIRQSAFNQEWPTDIPTFPKEAIRDRPWLDDWQKQVQRMWSDHITLLNQFQSEVEDDLNARQDQIDQLVKDVASLNSQIITLRIGT